MFNQLINILIVLFIILLFKLQISYSKPKKEEKENKNDYEKRIQIHKCNYERKRNYLCMGLVIVGGMYVYNKLQTQYEVVGGLIENMDNNEEFLYKTNGGNNLISDIEAMSDTESYISDNE